MPALRLSARCSLAVAVVLGVASARLSAAQGYVGPAKCYRCHEQPAKPSWEASHRKSGEQLDPVKYPKAGTYAEAAGGNPKDARCKACHTPDSAAASPTVTCETCHGPGQSYEKPHTKRPFYDGIDTLDVKDGMRLLLNKPAPIAKLCADCHVLGPRDQAIVDRGHASGAAFKLSAKLAKMKHWPSGEEQGVRARAYDAAFYASVEAAGSRFFAAVAKPAAAAARAQRPALPVTAGAASPAAPSPVAVPPRGDAYTDVTMDDIDAVLSRGGAGSTEGITRSSVPDLPAGEFLTPAPRTEAIPVRRPAARQARASPAASASPPAARLPSPKATAPLPSVPAVIPKDIHALRGLAAVKLRELILKKKTVALAPPSPAAEFDGADGELLSLQDEALSLALEVLSVREKKEPKRP